MELVRGYRGKLEGSLDPNAAFMVRMETVGNAEYDVCCFGVDAENKLSDDRYMVFYNQLSSPNNEITCATDGAATAFMVNLPALPPTIVKLVFTVSIDGAGTMGEIASHTLSLWQNGTERMRLSLKGSDFADEKAIIGAEIYNKTVWRIAAVASGFNGGLADLLASYGGESVEEQAAQPAPVQPNVQQVHPTPQPQPTPAQPTVQQVHPTPQPQQTPVRTTPTQVQPNSVIPPKLPHHEPIVPDYTPRPFVTVPLPQIPPIPPCAANDYRTAPLPTAPIAPPPQNTAYSTQPLPTGYMVEPESRFEYFR